MSCINIGHQIFRKKKLERSVKTQAALHARYFKYADSRHISYLKPFSRKGPFSSRGFLMLSLNVAPEEGAQGGEGLQEEPAAQGEVNLLSEALLEMLGMPCQAHTRAKLDMPEHACPGPK